MLPSPGLPGTKAEDRIGLLVTGDEAGVTGSGEMPAYATLVDIADEELVNRKGVAERLVSVISGRGVILLGSSVVAKLVPAYVVKLMPASVLKPSPLPTIGMLLEDEEAAAT